MAEGNGAFVGRYSRVVEELGFDPWTEERAALNNAAMDRALAAWEAQDRFMEEQERQRAAEADGSAYAQKALQDELAILAATPPGGRNTQINTSAFNLGQLVGGGLLDEEVVKASLEAVALSIGCDEDDLRAIKNGMAAGIKKPRTAPVSSASRNGAGVHSQTNGKKTPPPPREFSEADVATIADLVNAGSEVRWLWDDWLQIGVVNALAAEGGKGKTRFCADLLRRIRHGLPWPDGKPMTLPADTRSLWVLADNHHDEMVNLTEAFGIQDVVWLNAPKKDPYAGTSLETAEDLRDLEGRIKAIKPALVIVDTVGNSTDKNLSKQEDAKAYYQPLQVIARKYRCCVLCLTHLSADGKFLGRRVLEKVRVALKMEKPDATDDRRRLEVYKSNSKTPAALGVTMRDSGNDYDTSPPERAEYGESEPKTSPQLQKAMDWLKGQLRLGQRRVAEVRRAADNEGIGTNTLYKARDVLRVKEDGPKGHLTWELPCADTLPDGEVEEF